MSNVKMSMLKNHCGPINILHRKRNYKSNATSYNMSSTTLPFAYLLILFINNIFMSANTIKNWSEYFQINSKSYTEYSGGKILTESSNFTDYYLYLNISDTMRYI